MVPKTTEALQVTEAEFLGDLEQDRRRGNGTPPTTERGRALPHAEIKTEVMTVNMGPQHPEHARGAPSRLELDGETVLSASPTIGYLHTGIEKTTEQKKWQHWTERCGFVEQLIREGEAPPYAAVKCLANQQLGPLEDRRIGRIARQELLSGAVVIPEFERF